MLAPPRVVDTMHLMHHHQYSHQTQHIQNTSYAHTRTERPHKKSMLCTPAQREPRPRDIGRCSLVQPSGTSLKKLSHRRDRLIDTVRGQEATRLGPQSTKISTAFMLIASSPERLRHVKLAHPAPPNPERSTLAHLHRDRRDTQEHAHHKPTSSFIVRPTHPAPSSFIPHTTYRSPNTPEAARTHYHPGAVKSPTKE